MLAQQDSKLASEDVERAKAWVYEMYNMADCKDVDMVPRFLKDEATLNFASATPLKGRTAMERLFLWEYGACGQIKHSIQDIRVSHSHIEVKLSITYCFKNGSQQIMKCLAIWHKSPQDNQASRVDLEGDFSQVFEELSTVAGPPPL